MELSPRAPLFRVVARAGSLARADGAEEADLSTWLHVRVLLDDGSEVDTAGQLWHAGKDVGLAKSAVRLAAQCRGAARGGMALADVDPCNGRHVLPHDCVPCSL